MDLKRKLGLGSANGQSYELIRSTQSLVDRLNLNSEDISIQPVHPSIMGQVNYNSLCMHIIYMGHILSQAKNRALKIIGFANEIYNWSPSKFMCIIIFSTLRMSISLTAYGFYLSASKHLTAFCSKFSDKILF